MLPLRRSHNLTLSRGRLAAFISPPDMDSEVSEVRECDVAGGFVAGAGGCEVGVDTEGVRLVGAGDFGEGPGLRGGVWAGIGIEFGN